MSSSAPRGPTIYDISAAAGVAVSTVSKVLGTRSGNYAISPATRARILAVAHELGYELDPALRQRRGRRTGVIGVLHGTPTPFKHGVYESMHERLGAVMAAEGYRLEFLHASTWEDVRNLLSTRPMDGVLLMPYLPVGEPVARAALNLPLVVLNDRCSLAVPQVVADDAPGFAAAVQHVHELGHRRVLFADIERPQHHRSEGERCAVVLQAAGTLGMHAEAFCGTADEVLARSRALGATAIITYNNQLAFDLIPVLRAHQVRLPQDLSVICGTDMRVGGLVDPGLTSVTIPMADMADRACAELFALIQGTAVAGERVIPVPTHLVVRGSTGIPAGLSAG